MKKIIVLIVMISLLCLTGCSQDNLVCKMSNDENEGLKISQNIIIGFKDNKMEKIYLKSIIDLSNNYAKYADELATNLKNQYKDYEGKSGFEMKTSKSAEKITFMLKANLNKMDENTKNSFDLVSIGEDKAQIKNGLEAQGYECK